MNVDNLDDGADLIERFVLDRAIGTYEWDDGLDEKLRIPVVKAIHEVCGEVSLA
jgi:hypothetical protein